LPWKARRVHHWRWQTDLLDTRAGATYFAERVWRVSLRYDLGDDPALVGCSSPDFEREDGTRLGTLLRDGTGLLLDIGRQRERYDAIPEEVTRGAGRWSRRADRLLVDASEPQ
jgi:hypothetical protein